MSFFTRAGFLCALVFGCITGSGVAQADTYYFENITGNNATDAAIGEAQLSVDVTDAGGGNVLFTFNNVGTDASSITQIYFDDDVPLFADLIGIDDTDAGVDFDEITGTKLGPLPGGNTYGFCKNCGLAFEANSTPEVQPNGVNPGETLGLTFSLLSGETFNDVITALNDAQLRIGFHVQGFASGGSESFINLDDDGNSSGPVVPLPAALWLLLSGLGVLGAFNGVKNKLTA